MANNGENEQPTKVIFRVWRDKPHGVLALFPEDPADVNGLYCSSYEHMGGHGGADYTGCIARTRPAKPEEYAALKRELESYPYNYTLAVRVKRTPAMADKFHKTYAEWRKGR